MASSFHAHLSLHLILLPLHLLLLLGVAPQAAGCYPVIFSFGDSLTDTGNLVYFSGATEPASRLPFGETYFHQPRGRYCDGRIVLDFIAQAMGLPMVPPYQAGHSGENFVHGANFAVAGACALSNTFYEDEGFNVSRKDHSLSTQLKWFQQLLSSPSVPAPNDALNESLFIMGEIGVNDYSQMLLDGKTIDYVRTFVPPVVLAIGSTIEALIQIGAKTVLVGGMFPMGCIPMFLTKYQTQNAEAYDSQTGCIKWLNEFSQYHNLLLQKELGRVQEAHPHSKIIYADYYEVLMSIYTSPREYGIEVPLVACCGGEGPYNFSFSVRCGDPTSKWCSDPLSYVCWDGLHFTEAVNQVIARGILDGSYVNFPLHEHVCKCFV